MKSSITPLVQGQVLSHCWISIIAVVLVIVMKTLGPDAPEGVPAGLKSRRRKGKKGSSKRSRRQSYRRIARIIQESGQEELAGSEAGRWVTWAVPRGCIPEVHGSWHFVFMDSFFHEKILKIIFYDCVDIKTCIWIFTFIENRLFTLPKSSFVSSTCEGDSDIFLGHWKYCVL